MKTQHGKLHAANTVMAMTTVSVVISLLAWIQHVKYKLQDFKQTETKFINFSNFGLYYLTI